jgi:anti-sigma regulatory factor (Ser/Thr protein kinase)
MNVDPIPSSWPPDAPSRWSMTLPKDAPAVRQAREAVGQWLQDAPPRLRDDARTVVTELVSNAVRYGRPPIVLKVEKTARDWRIDVADAGTLRPRRKPDGDAGGWGLRIVGAMAESWGIADDASRVWCRLRPD